ncbi:hypothetical protein TYRP_005310 [Tyrophagus putrescentiae]|nr:hypothetical protein TYRP_005310 [Tyrophagus putrescentiae]
MTISAICSFGKWALMKWSYCVSTASRIGSVALKKISGHKPRRQPGASHRQASILPDHQPTDDNHRRHGVEVIDKDQSVAAVEVPGGGGEEDDVHHKGDYQHVEASGKIGHQTSVGGGQLAGQRSVLQLDVPRRQCKAEEEGVDARRGQVDPQVDEGVPKNGPKRVGAVNALADVQGDHRRVAQRNDRPHDGVVVEASQAAEAVKGVKTVLSISGAMAFQCSQPRRIRFWRLSVAALKKTMIAPRTKNKP